MGFHFKCLQLQNTQRHTKQQQLSVLLSLVKLSCSKQKSCVNQERSVSVCSIYGAVLPEHRPFSKRFSYKNISPCWCLECKKEEGRRHLGPLRHAHICASLPLLPPNTNGQPKRPQLWNLPVSFLVSAENWNCQTPPKERRSVTFPAHFSKLKKNVDKLDKFQVNTQTVQSREVDPNQTESLDLKAPAFHRLLDPGPKTSAGPVCTKGWTKAVTKSPFCAPSSWSSEGDWAPRPGLNIASHLVLQLGGCSLSNLNADLLGLGQQKTKVWMNAVDLATISRDGIIVSAPRAKICWTATPATWFLSVSAVAARGSALAGGGFHQ